MITVFTPAYNRADTLDRVYDSLKRQTSFDFEWIIIDDGSTDNTSDVVANFLDEKNFKVRYIKQNNGGKHVAHNKALELANGDYFFVLDSDDWLRYDAIENIIDFIRNDPNSDWIAAYKEDEKGNQLSSDFPKALKKTTLYKLNSEQGCTGEFTLVFRIDVARKFTFPKYENEKFMPECVVYDRIDRNCVLSLLPKVITTCEYQQDGLSSDFGKVMKNNPAGFCLYFMQRIDLTRSVKNRLIMAARYNCFKFFAKKNACEYTGAYKTIVLASKPLGLIFWLYYKLVRHF